MATTASRKKSNVPPQKTQLKTPRIEILSPTERAATGKAEREKVPLAAHAEFQPPKGRDPVGLLLSQAESRVQALVPIRHGRMLVSPFTFYRGAALVMAADLQPTPTSGLITQICGDAHLSNFGGYASPERHLVFDINDFDETLPGPFEWDVKRLAASFVVAGRDNGFSRKQCRSVTLTAVESYRTAMRTFAEQSILSVWYAHLDFENQLNEYQAALSSRKRKKQRSTLKSAGKTVAKSRSRDTLQALGKLTSVVNGNRRFVSDPPLIERLDDMTGLDTEEVLASIREMLVAYREVLPLDRRRLFDHFTLTDIAHKVVGVGSVGTRAWVLLFESGVESEVLLLQAKQSQRSALAGFAGESEFEHQGERVVVGQRLMQASSDIFLGWLRTHPEGRGTDDYYLRQLRDWKASALIEEMSPSSMVLYARLCGWTLARAHARAGDRLAIAAYLGGSDKFDQAIAEFAETYADQNERDYTALSNAVKTGKVEAVFGV